MVKIADVLEQRKLDTSPCVAHIPSFSPSSSIRSPTRSLSYQNAWKALKEHEKWLKNALPLLIASTSVVRKDDVVMAYLSSNSTDMMISMLAAASNLSSTVVALLNTRWTPSEMAAVLEASEGNSSAPTIILYSAEFRDKAIKTKSILQHTAYLMELPCLTQKYMLDYDHSKISRQQTAGHVSDMKIDSQIRKCAAAAAIESSDDALIVFTSGTTSGSKGVKLSHTALWIQALAKLRHPCRYSSMTNMLGTTVPLFHVGGLSSTLALWLAGGTWMIPSSGDNDTLIKGGFNPSTVLSLVSHNAFPTNTLVVVPAMLHALLLEQQRIQGVYPHVALILIGGQSAPRTILTKLRQVFPNARLVQTYACTEAGSSMTFYEPSVAQQEESSSTIVPGDCVGIPPPHVQLQLVSQSTNGDTKVGKAVSIITKPYQVGVLATSGPHIMSGYWKRGDSSVRPPKVFLTNDLGFRDDKGVYYFCGRGRDVIRTGGETVIAQEVERVLLEQGGGAITECAVFALPDDRFGEAVCVAIVLKNQTARLSLQEIRKSYCSSLAGYKRPRRLFLVNALPRNSSGKILKFKLIQQFTAPSKSKL